MLRSSRNRNGGLLRSRSSPDWLHLSRRSGPDWLNLGSKLLELSGTVSDWLELGREASDWLGGQLRLPVEDPGGLELGLRSPLRESRLLLLKTISQIDGQLSNLKFATITTINYVQIINKPELGG